MSDVFVASYVLLWVIAFGTAVVSLGAARQVALITRRFPPEVMNDPGPKLGTILQPITASDEAGDPVELPVQASSSKSVIVFMEDGCSTCAEVIPKLRELSGEVEGISMHVVLKRMPDADSVYRQSLAEWVVAAPETFEKWGISTVPFALVVNEGGMVEAKGHLLGEIGRLAETLGVEPRDGTDPERISGKESVEYERAGQQA